MEVRFDICSKVVFNPIVEISPNDTYSMIALYTHS